MSITSQGMPRVRRGAGSVGLRDGVCSTRAGSGPGHHRSRARVAVVRRRRDGKGSDRRVALTRSRHDRPLDGNRSVDPPQGPQAPADAPPAPSTPTRPDRVEARPEQDARVHRVRRVVSGLDLSQTIRDRSCVLFESAQSEDLLVGRSIEGSPPPRCTRTAGRRGGPDAPRGRRRGTGHRGRATCRLRRAEPGTRAPDGPHRPRRVPAAVRQRPRRPHDVERRNRGPGRARSRRGVVAGRNRAASPRAVCTPPPGELGQDLTQVDAADAADVSPVTLRTTYQALQDCS